MYLFNFYILIRKKIREFVINNKFIDNYFGNILVNLDILVRKMGFFESGLRENLFYMMDLNFTLKKRIKVLSLF